MLLPFLFALWRSLVYSLLVQGSAAPKAVPALGDSNGSTDAVVLGAQQPAVAPGAASSMASGSSVGSGGAKNGTTYADVARDAPPRRTPMAPPQPPEAPARMDNARTRHGKSGAPSTDGGGRDSGRIERGVSAKAAATPASSDNDSDASAASTVAVHQVHEEHTDHAHGDAPPLQIVMAPPPPGV